MRYCFVYSGEKDDGEGKECDPTLMNILAPVAERFCLLGEQKTDMDFLSLENSRVSSFLISCLITWRRSGRRVQCRVFQQIRGGIL